MARQSNARQELSDEMSRVFRNYQRSGDSLDELASALIGVNRTDARVIDLLEQEGRLTAGQIAAGAGLTSGVLNRGGDRLRPRGYARRVADEADRRKVLVEATEEVRRRAL